MVINESGRTSSAGSTVTKITRFISPLIPYLTVPLGLLVFHNAWAALLGYHLGMLIILGIARPGIPVRVLFQSNTWKGPLITTAFGASGILVYFLWPLFSISPDISRHLESIGLNGVTWPLFLAYFIIFNPFIEEYYWRGYLGSDSKRPALNDLFFAGYHVIVLAEKTEVIWLIFAFIVLACAAWFWRRTNRWSGGLLPSVMSHAAGDATVLLAVYFMVR